jgi:mannose-6-phosphate isomerase
VADERRGPWLLGPNRVRRFYRGGALLDGFRSGRVLAGRRAEATGYDSFEPEDWVGSATASWVPPAGSPTDEGLSRVTVDGRERLIAELLAADPEQVGGRDLVKRVGRPSTGLLVKLLDAAERLPVHGHPTRRFAHEHLDSPFGKTEAWHIVATREIPDAPPPSIRLGFRRDVGREELLGWIRDQRSEDLIDALHERPARAGDTWLVPAGMPHAIGAGVFIVELQEPTDFSIVAETRGFPIAVEDAALGRDWDELIDGFDRRGLTTDELDALRYIPGPPPIAGALPRARLTPSAADPYFRAERWTVTGHWPRVHEHAFLVGIVTRGEGTSRVGRGATLDLTAGTTFAVPAAGLPDLDLRGDGLQLIACLPPRPDDLARDWPG